MRFHSQFCVVERKIIHAVNNTQTGMGLYRVLWERSPVLYPSSTFRHIMFGIISRWSENAQNDVLSGLAVAYS